VCVTFNGQGSTDSFSFSLGHIYQPSGGKRPVSGRGETTTPFFQVRKKNLPCQSRPLLVPSSKLILLKTRFHPRQKEKKKSILLREGEEILFDESQLAAVVATVKYATVQRGGTRKPFQLVRFFFILPRCSALLCSLLTCLCTYTRPKDLIRVSINGWTRNP